MIVLMMKLSVITIYFPLIYTTLNLIANKSIYNLLDFWSALYVDCSEGIEQLDLIFGFKDVGKKGEYLANFNCSLQSTGANFSACLVKLIWTFDWEANFLVNFHLPLIKQVNQGYLYIMINRYQSKRWDWWARTRLTWWQYQLLWKVNIIFSLLFACE